MKNKAILNELFENDTIKINRGAIFDTNPPPKPVSFNFDRIEGMLLGVAIGDALGFPSESMLPTDRMSDYGEIQDYQGKGFPSDDTQLTFWTLEQQIHDRGFVPENIAKIFAERGRIYGIGSTVLKFLSNQKIGKPCHQCGPESAGNGALMRITPILIPHLKTGGTDIWVDTALAAMLTHNDRAAISSCLAFVSMLWELLDMKSAPDKEWWIQRYVELAQDLEGETKYKPRCRKFGSFTGPLWKFTEEKLLWADKQKMTVLDACNAWYSGAYLLETVPSVLFILMNYANYPEEAIIRAVNDTKDNDTIAAIVGAAVGALHGRSNFPERWINNLSGRTTENDDGHVFELIDEAKNTFWLNSLENI